MDFKPNVLCLEPLSAGMRSLIEEQLSGHCNLMFFDDVAQGETMLPAADAIIVFTKGISKESIKKATKCRVVQKLGAGYDKIDLQQLKEQGITLTVTKGVNARSVAEHAVLLMMAVYKRLVTAHNGILNGKWFKTALRDYSYEVTGKQVGFIGLGNIGKDVCKLLSGFDVKICYYDVFRLSEDEEKKLNVSFLPLEQLAKVSDIISLHVPLNESTRNLVNQKLLGLMKKTAIIVNTCRGEVVDEDALYDALASGKLLGAGLDVFTAEPLSAESKLRRLDNVVLSPHIGGGTMDAMQRVAISASKNILGVLSGDGPNKNDVIKL